MVGCSGSDCAVTKNPSRAWHTVCENDSFYAQQDYQSAVNVNKASDGAGKSDVRSLRHTASIYIHRANSYEALGDFANAAADRAEAERFQKRADEIYEAKEKAHGSSSMPFF